MARLGSQAKAGFYPTPDSVCEILKSKITFEDGARLLDPCCGKGITLSRLATASTPTYGIELSHERASEARTRLNEVLWCDALQESRFTYHAFGLLYLNPPYDTAINPDEKSQRMETLFLRRYINALQSGGFLVFVIPYYVLANQIALRHLPRNFYLQVLGFPKDDFQTFKQCMVFGRRKRVHAEQAENTEHRLMELGRMEPEEFMEEVTPLEIVAPFSINVPAANQAIVQFFKSIDLIPLKGIPVVRKAGILRKEPWKN